MNANTHDVISDAELPDAIGSHAAARILGSTIGSICRYVRSGYLPTVRRSTGSGSDPHLFDRQTVEDLAEARALAARLLDVDDWQAALAAVKAPA